MGQLIFILIIEFIVLLLLLLLLDMVSGRKKGGYLSRYFFSIAIGFFVITIIELYKILNISSSAILISSLVLGAFLIILSILSR